MYPRQIAFAITATLLFELFAALFLVARAESPTYYFSYYHQQQRSEEDPCYGKYTSQDTIAGPLRTDDTIIVWERPIFRDEVITSAPVITHWQDNAEPQYAQEPILGVPEYSLPATLPNLRDMAANTFSSHGGQFVTWIRLMAEEGADIFQYPVGSQPNDSLIDHIGVRNERVIFVDGTLRLEGRISWASSVTIYATGDIQLIDDVRYNAADDFGRSEWIPWFSPSAFVSEQNIVVMDTYRNGKNDGYNVNRNHLSAHSIALDGSYVALRGSFTFENQNNPGDRFQGSTPDNRGFIYLTGGIAQYTRVGLSNQNHNFTGYGINFQYDEKLRTMAPPGFRIGEFPEIGRNCGIVSYYDTLELYATTTDIFDVAVRQLTIHPGATLTLHGVNALTVTERIQALAYPERPIIFRGATGSEELAVEGDEAEAVLRSVELGNGLRFDFSGAVADINNCYFWDSVTVTGSGLIDSSGFEAPLTMTGDGVQAVSRSLILAGVTFSGSPTFSGLVNCDVIGSSEFGVKISEFANPTILNSIIANNRIGLINEREQNIDVRYCDLFGSDSINLVNAHLGDGCIEANAFFESPRLGIYRLRPNSPCIDAGDPNSPRDPDGSRADMGAFPFDHRLSVESDGRDARPTQSDLLSAYPNPFNAVTTIRFTLPQAGWMRISVVDVMGKEVSELASGRVSEGEHSVVWDVSSFPAGVYLVRLEGMGRGEAMKVVVMK